MDTTELKTVKKDIEAIKGALLCLSQGPYMRSADLKGFIEKINPNGEE